MDSEIFEIKQRYGDSAKDIIISESGLETNGKKVQCPWTRDHPDIHPSAEWDSKNYHFHCYACKHKSYDIINHMVYKHGKSESEAIQDLKEELGIKSKFYQSKQQPWYKPTDQNKPPEKPMPEPGKNAKKEAPEQDLNYKLYIYNLNYNKYIIKPLDPEWPFFKDKKIRHDVAKDFFHVEAGHLPEDESGIPKKIEILMHGFNVDGNGKYIRTRTKRRNADNEFYDPDTKKVKEIAITRTDKADGVNSLFGLHTLFNKDNSPKDTAAVFEGFTDTLRSASEIITDVEDKLNDYNLPYGLLSVSNGSNTLKSSLDNPVFKNWYQKHCKRLIIIPDADSGRDKMLADAKELPDSDKKVRWFDLTVIPGIDYRIKKGQDASDALDILDNDWESFFDEKQLQYLPIDDLIIPGPLVPEDGLKSGNVTEDYNNTGMKGLICKAGADGQGKTTEMRKKMIHLAQQKIKSYVYFGEGHNVNHLRDMHLAGSVDEERFIYTAFDDDGISKTFANQDGVDRYNRDYAPYITICDQKEVKGQSKLDTLLHKMEQHAKQGCKVFFIDNLTVILDTSGRKTRDEAYGYTCQKLKDFTDEYDVITYLLHHMLKDGSDIYGSSQIRNIVDVLTILRRLDDPRMDKKSLEEALKTIQSITGINDEELENITAMEVTYKIRDRGQVHLAIFTFNQESGCAEELVWNPIMNRMATHYIEMGFPCNKASTLKVIREMPKKNIPEEIVVENTADNHTADDHTADNHTADNHTTDQRSSKKIFFQNTIAENKIKKQKYQEEQAKIRKVN